MPFVTPILFIIFNRPEETKRVFAAIKKLQPRQLFIAADGPRNEADQANCLAAREVIKEVDWECDLKLLVRENNVGVKLAGSSAIDWFFSQVEQGIILEDDCLPDQSFFPFCQAMLERYKNNERIMHISGDNFQQHKIEDSYYFSQIPHIWGWATWRRAWQHYDIKMTGWPEFAQAKKINKLFKEKIFRLFWTDVFRQNHLGLDNGWDFQWAFAMFNNNGLAIHPQVNLISNIGFGAEASHAFDSASAFANLPTEALTFPLKHPADITIDGRADDLVMRRNLGATYHNFFFKLILKKLGLFQFFKKTYYALRGRL